MNVVDVERWLRGRPGPDDPGRAALGEAGHAVAHRRAAARRRAAAAESGAAGRSARSAPPAGRRSRPAEGWVA